MAKPLLHIYWVALLCVAAGCASSGQFSPNQEPKKADKLKNIFTLALHQSPDSSIQSVQLHPEKYPGKPPILALKDNNKLLLQFDYFEEESAQFRISFSHRNSDWSQSSLSPNFFMEGFSESTIIESDQSISQRPAYTRFSYRFPNEELKFKVSGNYILEVSDYRSGETLFTLPFFVSEQEGALSTKAETRYTSREDLRRRNQLFSEYKYPNFVEMPRFDLSFFYAPNQFWGRIQESKNFDTATPGSVHFQQEEQQAFPADFTFFRLDLANFYADGEQILEIDETTTPPTVLLKRDVPQLQTDFSTNMLPQFSDDRDARYAKVKFQLEPGDLPNDSTKIYLVGDFNQWMIGDQQKLQFNSDSGLWETTALVKQGQYAYKYVLVEEGTVKELISDQGFRQSPQQYTTFVYFRDPARNYDRLLQTRHQTVE